MAKKVYLRSEWQLWINLQALSLLHEDPEYLSFNLSSLNSLLESINLCANQDTIRVTWISKENQEKMTPHYL